MDIVRDRVVYHGEQAACSCCPFLMVMDCGDGCGRGHLWCGIGDALPVGRVRDVCLARFDRCGRYCERVAVGSGGRSMR